MFGIISVWMPFVSSIINVFLDLRYLPKRLGTILLVTSVYDCDTLVPVLYKCSSLTQRIVKYVPLPLGVLAIPVTSKQRKLYVVIVDIPGVWKSIDISSSPIIGKFSKSPIESKKRKVAYKVGLDMSS